MAFRFEFNVKPRRGIIQLVIERDDKLLCLDLTPKEVATLNTKSGFAYQILDDYDQDELDQYNRNMEVH